MKYLLPLLFLVGCETFPEEREEPHFMEQVPRGRMEVDNSIKLEEPFNSIEDMGVWNLIPVYRTVEIDVSFFTHRRYMVYINVMEK